MSPIRPASVTLLLWLVLSLSAWGALRFAAALRWWDVLMEFGSTLHPLYLSIGGAIWFVAGIVLYRMLGARKPHARSALLAAAVLWYGQFWVERLFFHTAHTNNVFVLFVTTLLLALITMVTYLPVTKHYFIMSEENEQAEKPTETP